MDTSVLPEKITIGRFSELLGQYDVMIKSVSSEKPLKAGQSSLLELDDYRYKKATETFRSKQPKRQMTHDDVKTLVDWKLRHGKFRPTLMKLVSSNDGEVVGKTIHEAMTQYWLDDSIVKAMDSIAKLKGIGPATASLLLSVHDPDRVIFFSDEAYWWLCCNGQKSPIKYSAKEYQQLNVAANNIAKRLQVGASDIEKVAYVIMKDDARKSAPSTSRSQSNPHVKKAKATEEDIQKVPAKRRNSSVTNSSDMPLRRSQRHKAS
ncbi:hypothetical protein GGR55DRAFT_681647 [Xylaria sp. FL0064]|nr:hypothetical protein GGR55DRAFT_681647 [Xylaria sp. FL0064]